MSNIASDLIDADYFDGEELLADDCDVLALNDFRDRESLSENFYDEMDAWFRRAIASNGFGGI